MSEDYKQKYLEYKVKYIKLKQSMQNTNQIGGTPPGAQSIHDRIEELCEQFSTTQPSGYTQEIANMCDIFRTGAYSSDFARALLSRLENINRDNARSSPYPSKRPTQTLTHTSTPTLPPPPPILSQPVKIYSENMIPSEVIKRVLDHMLSSQYRDIRLKYEGLKSLLKSIPNSAAIEIAFKEYEKEDRELNFTRKRFSSVSRKMSEYQRNSYIKSMQELEAKVNNMHENIKRLVNEQYERYGYTYNEDTLTISSIKPTELIITGTPEAEARLQATQIYRRIIENLSPTPFERRAYEVYESTGIRHIIEAANMLQITPNELFKEAAPSFLSIFKSAADKAKEEQRQTILNELRVNIINRRP